MGQTASTTQQEEEQTPHRQNSERERDRQHPSSSSTNSSPSNSTSRRSQAIRSGLHASRSLRGKNNNDSPAKAGSATSKDGESSRTSGGAGQTSPTKPRRKSLDMPDMSLSMTGNVQGGAGGSSLGGSGAVTPVSAREYYDGGDGGDLNEGIPLAHGPVSAVSGTASSNLTSPTSPLHASSSISSRWGRGVRSRNNTANGGVPGSSSNTEGLVKKAQPITGGPSALHAAGYSADRSTILPVLSTSPNMAQYTSPPSSTLNTPTHNKAQLPAISTQNLQAQQQQQQRDASPSIHQQLSAGTGAPYNATASASSSRSASTSSSRSASTARPGMSSGIASTLPRDVPPSALGMMFDSLQSATEPPSMSSSPSNNLHPSVTGDGSVPPPLPSPLRQPTETILAPKLPPNVNLTIPVSPTNAAHDIIEAHTFVNIVSNTGHIFASPADLPHNLIMQQQQQQQPMIISSAASAGISSPLLPGSTPPLLNPPNTLPAAAPLSALNPSLATADPKTQEAVHAATVDLGAGPDGVPTLLTWKADQEVSMVTYPNPEDINGISAADSRETSPARITRLVPSDAMSDTRPGGSAGPSERRRSAGQGTNDRNTARHLEADGSMLHAPQTPEKVFVTGTFAKGWSTKIELRRKENDPKHGKDFTALVRLPPGPHSLKFIVDKQWKTSKYLPSATDADGNLINYLQVHKAETGPRQAQHPIIEELEEEEDEDEDQWSSSIPEVLLAYGEATESAADYAEAAELEQEERNAAAAGGGSHSVPVGPLPGGGGGSTGNGGAGSYGNSPSQGGSSSIPSVLPNPGLLALNRKPLVGLGNIKPPTLPAQLEKGVLNATVLIAKGSGDDNSLLPKPDHSVLNHLAASPIKGGLLSVGVTTRYRRKYVTTVYYKKPM